MAVFGVCLGGSFAPNHKGMPIVPASSRIDFFHRQVLMSRNVRGGALVDFAMGGLNYQIEHHLFPSMPRPNLKLVQPTVQAVLRGPRRAVHRGGAVRVLRHRGQLPQQRRAAARGPFECPITAQYRT